MGARYALLLGVLCALCGKFSFPSWRCKMSSYIVATGAALPDRKVSNAELASLLEVAPEWIEANCGIRERRWVTPDQAASDLAASAVRDALNNATLGADQIDYLIGGTLS